jgi:hypothetical protein
MTVGNDFAKFIKLLFGDTTQTLALSSGRALQHFVCRHCWDSKELPQILQLRGRAPDAGKSRMTFLALFVAPELV